MPARTLLASIIILVLVEAVAMQKNVQAVLPQEVK